MKFLSKVSSLVVFGVGRFVDGELETNKKRHIEILDRVPEVSRADGSEPEVKELEKKEISLEEMSAKQLKDYAKKNKIELKTSLRAKKDILDAILEAEA